jgi:dolichyl-phosphate beta-glucosyltransferase
MGYTRPRVIGPDTSSTTPELSIVVPAYNEAGAIGSCLQELQAHLNGLGVSWEVVVVDDGSSDGTAAIVAQHAKRDPRIRLIPGGHAGKGKAIRRGALEARGAWRFMADADLAMPLDNLERVLGAVTGPTVPHIVIGSREGPGAQRIGEHPMRHAIGRTFNTWVRLLVLPGLHDTQCGFKLFSATAAEALFPRLTVDGFAFDVELLVLAKRAGFEIQEVGIVWRGRPDSRVAVGRGAAAFGDVVRIWWSALTGRYGPVTSRGSVTPARPLQFSEKI